MGRFSKAAMIGLGLFVAGIALAASLHGNRAGAEPQPEPAAEKVNTGSDAAADISNIKVATILGRDIFRKDIEPPAKWFEDREKYVKLHGEKMGYVTPDVYRMDKLREAIWKPLSEKLIPKKDVEPTEEELQKFIVSSRQGKARIQQEQQKQLEQLRTEADKLEKLLPTQDSEDQEEAMQRIQKMRKEIAAIERSFEIHREIQAKRKNSEQFEQFSAKWWVGHWKQQQWFYKRYGGRVIYQQVGPEAIDAMRDFLKEAESKKDFVIYDQELNTKFWAPYTKEHPGVFVPNPDKVFEHPWSIMDRSVNDKQPPVAPPAKGQPPVSSKPAFEMVGQGSSAAAFPMELSLEDDAKAEISIKLGREKTLHKMFPGTVKLDLTALGDGQHNLYIECPGYATKVISVQTAGDKASREQVKTKLYRKRYVILRCAFNTYSGRTLEGDDMEEQRIALSHWTAPKYFSEDWQISQRSRAGGDTPCDTPYIDFHRYTTGFGIVKPAKGISYEEMKVAPEGEYRCKSQIAKKGLLLYCRVKGNSAEPLGYGKLMVEDVTETPPKDVRIVEVRE